MGFTPPLPAESRPEPPAWGEVLAWERGLLGAILHDPSIHAGLSIRVAAEDFTAAIHSRLFQALPRLTGADGSIDRAGVPEALGVYAWDAPDGVEVWLDGLLAARADPARLDCLADGIRERADRERQAPEPIEVDTAAWSHHQAARLARLAERQDELSRSVDWASIIEEVLYVGRSQTGGVVRKLELLFEHLVKLLSDPDAPSRNRWRIEIEAFRLRIAQEAKPAMRQVIDLDAAWRKGVKDAEADLAAYAVRLPRDLPKVCPFSYEDLTGERLTVADLLEKLAASGDMDASTRP